MGFGGVDYKKLNGGLGGRNPSGDKVFGLIAGGVVTAEYDTLGTIVQLLQLSDAEDLGIDAAYDSNNSVLLHYHIEEFFEDNPDSVLWLQVVAQGTSQTEMVDKAEAMAYKMMTDEASRNKVRVIGTVLNPVAPYAPTTTDGIDEDVLTAIPKAQDLIDTLAAEGILLDGIVLEGRNLTTTIADVPDLRAETSRNVSVVVAADPAVIALDADYAGSAAVGTFLRSLGVRQISENAGSVQLLNMPEGKEADESYPLNNGALGRWESAALSSGTLFSALTTTEKDLLTTRGVIYVGKFENYTGYYFNDSSTCIELADDYAYIENNRIWNKAVRLLNEAMIPRIRSKFKKDTDTGYPAATAIAGWKSVMGAKLQLMVDDNDISGYTLYIDPAQDVKVGTPLVVKVGLIVDGILREIEIQVGLSNPAANA